MRRSILLPAAIAATLSICASTQAAPVIVGSPLKASFIPTEAHVASTTVANIALTETGAQVTSPVTGAIVAWHLLDAEGGPFALRVLRPGAPGSYATVTATATSGPATPTGLGLQTFPTSLPISAGDLIGLDVPNPTDLLGVAPGGGEFAAWRPTLTEGIGASQTEGPVPIQVAFDAEVQPAPTITALDPTS